MKHCHTQELLKSIRAPRDVRKKWLRVAVLGSCTALAACLFWGSLGGDDGITEVLAHRSERKAQGGLVCPE